jgi:DNA polymerase-3 subunit alpha
LAGADILRKAMGKKNPEVMAKQRSLFQEGAEARGIGADLATSIFDLMEKFAGYGFNKSHSAAYALVSYQTAWLKTHHPACFMAAVLTAEMQNTDKIVTLIDECRSMQLVIVPPDINRGQFNFTVNEKDEIVYGLGAIKGLGEGPVDSILAAREEGPFMNMLDICQRVDTQNVNKRTMEALVRSGALDNMVEGDLDYARALLSALLPQAMQAAEQSSRNQASGVEDMFGEIAPAGTEDADLSASNIKVRAWAEQHRLKVEKDTLGLWLSGHPIDEFLDELSHITKNRLVNLRPERGPQTIAGVLHSIRTMKNKVGDTIAFLVLDDSSARFEFSLFAKEYEKYRETLHKDVIMVVECAVSIDDYNGGMRGRGKSVMTLSQARKRNAHRVALNLESESLGSNFCEHLAGILEPYRKPAEVLEVESAATANGSGGSSAAGISTRHQHPGQFPPSGHTVWAADEGEGCQVMVRYQRADSIGCIMLGREWVVSPADDLIQRLRLEYGKDKVVLSYK